MSVHARGESPMRLAERVDDVPVLGLGLVRRVDEHETAALGRRHEADAARKTVLTQHADAPIGRERSASCAARRDELEQIQAVVSSQHLSREPRRARVTRKGSRSPLYRCTRSSSAPRLGAGGSGGRPELSMPDLVFAVLLRVARPQAVPAGARVRLDVAQRLGLRGETSEDADQHDVLEHVGVVAGVKRV